MFWKKYRDYYKLYYVYIMSSKSRVLCIGMTNNIIRRVMEHRNNVNDGFTKKYHCHILLYYEIFESPMEAISREKQIKRWRRSKKVKLINSVNPNWHDLFNEL
ncbi:MAG: GIY-YIG nuclease family protein [Candidatus Komeilibacteria bacterium]